jgi:mono/diheme cytochrome c family protein
MGEAMKKIIRWAALCVAVVVVLAGALALLGNVLAERKRERIVKLDVAPVPYTSDPAALDRGRYLFLSRGCAECHGRDGAGRVVDEASNGLYIKSPNIARGTGSAVATYREVDWVRTVRHGVKPDGRPLLIMPSEDYNRLTDADLAALVAYVRSLPPAAGEGAVIRLPMPMKVAYGFGAIKDAAQTIDHTLPPQRPVAEGATVEHGNYVARMCVGCHGSALAGGKINGGPPDWPPAANLTPGTGSVMPRYDSADKLKAMFRGGKRADGSAIAAMPFDTLREISDVDIEALYLYLKTLPARGPGG